MSFVQNAIRFQESAETIAQADKSFEISCDMCCKRGLMTCDCDFCHIQHAHSIKIETLKMIKLLNEERGGSNERAKCLQ